MVRCNVSSKKDSEWSCKEHWLSERCTDGLGRCVLLKTLAGSWGQVGRRADRYTRIIYKIFSSRRRTQQQQHSFTSWLVKEETAKGSSQQRQQTLEDHRLENHRVNSSQLIVSPIFLTTSICRTKQSKRSRQNTIFPTKIPHQSKMIKSSLQYRTSPRI